MDKIKKALNKFSAEEQSIAAEQIHLLLIGEDRDLNIKRLKGTYNVFRLRKGRMRILFRITNGEVEILAIGNRNEKTYRGF